MSVIKRWNEDIHNKQLKEIIDKLGAGARNLQQIIAKACIFGVGSRNAIIILPLTYLFDRCR
jgi:hypothetical protein